jgi:tetratricopeptide (TPR) repeat protein
VRDVENGDVFISHSSADRQLADIYCDALEAAGISCWLANRNIAPSMNYPQAIVQSINACGAFLVIYSERSSTSDHVVNEIERAFNARKPILVIRTDSEDPGTNDRISYFLATNHWFDAAGLRPDQYLPRLVASVRDVLDGGQTGGKPTPVRAEAVADAVFSTAGELERTGRWEEASQRYRELLGSASERVRCNARIRLARCLLETCNRGETDEAEDLLAEAERMSILQDDQALRGELLLQQGRLDDLNARLKHALAKYERARAALESASFDLAEVDLVLASAERRRGEYNKSLERLSSLDTSALPEWLRAEFYDELGATLLARGQARDAVVELEKGLALDDATGSEYAGGRSKLLLAQAFMRVGSLDQAFTLIEEAITAYRREESTAGLSEAYGVMGSWYEDREDYTAAIHAYLDSYEHDRTSGDLPGMIRAKRRLARAYRKRGDYARARELLTDARELLSADDDVERAAILREEGHLAISGSNPDYEEGIRLFEAALAIAEEDEDERTIAIAKRDLAAAYRADDDFERAEALLLEAREAFERRGDLHELDDLLDDLGELKLESDKYPEARTYLLESLKLDNELGRVASKARSLLLLGRVASRTADQDMAGEHFEEARELYEKARNDVGLSDALKALAGWQLTQGQVDAAVQRLQQSLDIDNRLDRRLGRVHAKRLLAAAMRERGNPDRGAEYLTDAREDLEGINDPVERAMLDFEDGRLRLAANDNSSARTLLERARRVFERNNSPVDAASCQRFLALAAAYEGRYGEALTLLGQAKKVFEDRGDFVELDDLYDDLGTVNLLRGDYEEARACVEESLKLGQQGSWKRGKGRSLIILAKIANARHDRAATRRHLDDALELFQRIGDEIGQATALVELGDWHAASGVIGPDLSDDRAVAAYKDARRLLQHHRNRHDVARCNRKLALVYLDRGELQRADEALADARAELWGVDDPRDVAPLEFACGKLESARNDHAKAVEHLGRALDGFTLLGQDDRRNETHRLLVNSYQAQGDFKSALDCIRQMNAEKTAMYTVLVDELDDGIARAATASFASGAYANAVDLAFGELEREFRSRAMELQTNVATSAPVADHIAAWGELAPLEEGSFLLDRAATQMFARFCSATFDVVRSPAYRGLAERPEDAFAALSIAHWIALSLRTMHAGSQARGESLSAVL